MVCSKCGAELKEGAKFCVSCGAPVEAVEATPVETVEATPAQETTAQATPNPAPAKPAVDVEEVKKAANDAADKLTDTVSKVVKKDVKKPVVLGALAGVAALVVVLVLAIIISSVASGYKKPIKNLAKGINKENEKTIAKCFAPLKLYEDEYDDFADIYNDMEKVKIEIYDKHKMTKSERNNYAERCLIAELKDDDIKISNCYKVVVHMEYEYDGDKRCTATEVVVGKYKGNWYILGGLY